MEKIIIIKADENASTIEDLLNQHYNGCISVQSTGMPAGLNTGNRFSTVLGSDEKISLSLLAEELSKLSDIKVEAVDSSAKVSLLDLRLRGKNLLPSGARSISDLVFNAAVEAAAARHVSEKYLNKGSNQLFVIK